MAPEPTAATTYDPRCSVSDKKHEETCKETGKGYPNAGEKGFPAGAQVLAWAKTPSQ